MREMYLGPPLSSKLTWLEKWVYHACPSLNRRERNESNRVTQKEGTEKIWKEKSMQKQQMQKWSYTIWIDRTIGHKSHMVEGTEKIQPFLLYIQNTHYYIPVSTDKVLECHDSGFFLMNCESKTCSLKMHSPLKIKTLYVILHKFFVNHFPVTCARSKDVGFCTKR